MKKLYVIVAFAICGAAAAQKLSPELSVAVKESGISVPFPAKIGGVELSYYSRNYTQVFGSYNYTFDSLNYGSRNVFVGPNSALYYNNEIPEIFITMPMAGVNVNACNALPWNAYPGRK